MAEHSGQASILAKVQLLSQVVWQKPYSFDGRINFLI